MPEELNVADIQMPFLEYRANYKESITSLWFGLRQGDIVDAFLKALAPQLTFEGVTWNQAAKNLAEAHISFSLPSLFSTILVGIRGVTISVLNADWSRIPLLTSVLQSAVDALKAGIQKELEAQQITLAFHLKPGAKAFRERMTRFVNSKALASDDAKSFGVSVYYPDSAFVIDSSGVVPDGLFVKVVRTFSAQKRFEEIATVLYKDEEAVLHRLGLKLI